MQIPAWLNRFEYPFSPHWMDLPAGRMHYVDEGNGETIVMLHGNPDWSYAYRNQIKALRHDYRCIAPDLIGFGLSDKPQDWSYLPEDHAYQFELFVRKLHLHNITLVLNDWGGPIGLHYALRYPENVKRLVIMNTWMWPVKDDWYYQIFSGFMGSKLGKWLIRHFDFFNRFIAPIVVGNKEAFTKDVWKHYRAPLQKPEDRKGNWTFPGQIVGSSAWLSKLWEQRDKISNKPALLFWGMKDIGFRKKELQRWEKLLNHKKVIRVPHCGHFPQEEASEQLIEALKAFIATSESTEGEKNTYS